MAPGNGDALLLLTLTAGSSLDEAAAKTLQQYNLVMVESKKESINGLASLIMVADQGQEAGTIRVLSALIQFEGKIYSLMGISELSKFATYQPSFLFTIQNFKELKDQQKLNRKPEVVRIKSLSQPMTLQAAFQSFNMPAERFEELAILNGMLLSDKLSKGSLIKVIGK